VRSDTCLSARHGKKATHECPCGHLGDGSDRCLCDPGLVARYQGKVSGPLLDRIDLHVQVPAVPFRDLGASASGASTADVRARVERARGVQRERLKDADAVFANGQMRVSHIRRWCRPSREVTRLLQEAMDRMGLSARGYHRILRVARTIADLASAEEIDAEHAAEAIQYRGLDRGVG